MKMRSFLKVLIILTWDTKLLLWESFLLFEVVILRVFTIYQNVSHNDFHIYFFITFSEMCFWCWSWINRFSHLYSKDIFVLFHWRVKAPVQWWGWSWRVRLFLCLRGRTWLQLQLPLPQEPDHQVKYSSKYCYLICFTINSILQLNLCCVFF